MGSWRVGIVLVLGGCGRLGFELHAGDARGTEGLIEDGEPADACALGAWTLPVPLTTLNAIGGFDDYAPDLSADGLTLVYASNRSGDYDLYLSRRSAIGQPWQAPMLLSQTNSAAQDMGAQLTADGLTLYFTSTRTGAERLHRATRASVDDLFGTATQVAELAGENVLGLALASDDTEVIYTTYFMMTDLRRARLVGGVFTLVDELSELNTPGHDAEASLSTDSLTMYFHSDRGGDVEIYRAVRPTPTSAFGPPVIVSELNGPSGFWSVHPAISTDGTELFFGSNRPGSSAFDLYVATRSCP